MNAEAGAALAGLKAFEQVAKAMEAKEPPAALLDSIAATNQGEAIDWLADYIVKGAPRGDLQRMAVRAMGRSRNGEIRLYDSAKNGRLPDSLKFAAGSVLAESRDARLRESAAEILPMPAAAGDKPLPPIAELAKRTGDAARGKAVYQKACIACHKVGDEGIDFGPALTEIGSKLAREAMYEAIFDPGAAISFGFEGFEVTQKNGDVAVGYVASETDDLLSLRAPGGITLPIKKSDIASRKAYPESLMTPNLQSALTEQELVDLVEYLGSLRKR
jgi:putative heme-binding domain-containing protein